MLNFKAKKVLLRFSEKATQIWGNCLLTSKLRRRVLQILWSSQNTWNFWDCSARKLHNQTNIRKTMSFFLLMKANVTCVISAATNCYFGRAVSLIFLHFCGFKIVDFEVKSRSNFSWLINKSHVQIHFWSLLLILP